MLLMLFVSVSVQPLVLLWHTDSTLPAHGSNLMARRGYTTSKPTAH